jgi:hypothetical protein
MILWFFKIAHTSEAIPFGQVRDRFINLYGYNYKSQGETSNLNKSPENYLLEG